jgi:phosphatidylserine decarboxylase
MTGSLLWFFRDPERQSTGEGLLASADGVVQSIDAWPDGRTRVATFMNPLNVHVNRAPADGTVISVTHLPGGFLPAFNKDSDRNERMVWLFDTEFGELEVVQIAGAMVRRIVPYIAAGDKTERGRRIGLIRFGSRVDVYLPPGVEPAVSVGDKTVAGVTRLDRERIRD